MSESIGMEPDDLFLRAQFACQSLVVEAARLADSGRAVETLALFTPSGERVLDGRAISGADLRRFLERRDAMTSRRTRHCISNISFRLMAADRARMSSTCVVYLVSNADEERRTAPETIIDFMDEFVRDERGVWRFARREAVIQAGMRSG